MCLSVVNMEIQAACGFKQAVGCLQARAQKSEIIIKSIAVMVVAHFLGAVKLLSETGPITLRITLNANSLAGLLFASVEWRVDVNQVNRLSGQLFEHGEVIGKVNLIAHAAYFNIAVAAAQPLRSYWPAK